MLGRSSRKDLTKQSREVARSVSGLAKRLNTGYARALGSFGSWGGQREPRSGDVATWRLLAVCFVEQGDFFQHAVQAADDLLLEVQQ